MIFDVEKFVDTNMGKGIDVDGAYGVQCWDLFAHFCKQHGVPWKVYHCGSTGYVRDVWNNRWKTGASKYFDFIEGSENYENGDWVIWNTGKSHVAMYYNGLAFGTNQSRDRRACFISLNFKRSMGALRFKQKVNIEAKKDAEVVANEVIAGMWGNGEVRRKRLKAAGYSPAMVQLIVNRILGANSLESVAREVIAGKWGNGRVRYEKLTAAGYDYKKVQNIVNKMLQK